MRALITTWLLICASAAMAQEREWAFRVLLDGREIGQHRFSISTNISDGTDVQTVRSEARFDVRVLFVSAYRYAHNATERWERGCLRSLAAQTQTNSITGTVSETVHATTRNGRLMVERAGLREEHEGCVMSFAYWSPTILGARQLLNSQTGELLPVSITALGTHTIDVRGQPTATQRHRISARGLQIDVWYAQGNWVALEAPASGGRVMRYELI